jgi:hypothetical protein
MTAFFDAVRSAALLGTHHATPAIPSVDPALDAIVAPRDGEPAERTLLRAAAVAATLRRAGATARASEGYHGPYPEDDSRPPCSSLAIANLLETSHRVREHVREWVGVAVRVGKRIPEEYLPDAIEIIASADLDRDDLANVLGARGVWLASQNRAWAFVGRRLDPWTTFAHNPMRIERVEALRAMRAADPVRARETLARGWDRERPDDRIALLTALEITLSRDDEPFLERARSDREQRVSDLANDLLHRISDSAAARRALTLVLASLAVVRSDGGLELSVTVPDRFLNELAAEGIRRGRLDENRDPGDWWLEQIVTATPIHALCHALEVDFRTFVSLALAFADAALVRGMTASIKRYRDAEALASLLEDIGDSWPAFERFYAADHDALAPDVREHAVLVALCERRSYAHRLLSTVTAPWSAELSSAAVDDANRALCEPGSWQYPDDARHHLGLLASRVDPRTPGILTGWGRSFAVAGHEQAVENFRTVVARRKAIYDCLEDTA